jgi:hypothetical protein
MSEDDRRNFLLTGRDMVLGALTAGTLVACASGGGGIQTVEAQTPASGPSTAAFGWEIDNLGNNGACAYFSVQRDLVLNVVDVDLAFSPYPQPTQGLAEALCRGMVSRGGPPSFQAGPNAFFFPPSSSAFGALQTYNPTGLTIGTDAAPFQDTFLNVILKSWVPSDGTASQAYRHVQLAPSLSLKAGDYLVFYMGHDGPAVDAEMQVILVFQ